MVTARVAAENRLQGFRVGADRLRPQALHPRPDLRGDGRGRRLAAAGSTRRRTEGEIPLDAARRRAPRSATSPGSGSLLLARTPLAEDAARRLDQVLRDLGLRADDWGQSARRRPGRRPSATGSSRDRVDPDPPRRVRLVPRRPPRTPDGLGGLIARGRFDEVACNDRPARSS